MSSKGFLFAEPSVAETGVWVELSHGKDPAQWAYFCRYIGKLSPREFDAVVSSIETQQRAKICRAKEVFEVKKVPLVSIGCSGIGGEYQRDM